MVHEKITAFALVSLVVLLLGCEEAEKQPFTAGSSFVYATTYTTPDGRKTKYDTLTFTIQERELTAYSIDIKKIKWENTRHNYYQYRGLTTDDGLVELQLPLNYPGFDREMIAVTGHPMVSLSGHEKYTLERQNKYASGYGKLSGLAIKQQTVELGDTSVLFDGELLECKLLKCENLSHTEEFGKYTLIYTYNRMYGFMSLDYFYPGGKIISMQLIDVSIANRS